MDNIKTLDGFSTSIQISNLGDIPRGKDFEVLDVRKVPKPFLIKNLSDDPVDVTIITIGGSEVTTKMYPGWNVELIIKIKSSPNSLQYGY